MRQRWESTIDAYAWVAASNRAALDRLQRVLSCFADQGLECLLLKGADLIGRLYGVLGLRPMTDVDLLIHAADLQAIDAVLDTLGYRPHIDGNPAYVDPDGVLGLDLITDIWYVDDGQEVWRRAVKRSFEGIPVKGMAANDLLIYLTAYNVVHRGYLTPSFAHDIARLVEKEPLDWTLILEDARRWRVRPALAHGLSYAVSRDDVAVPPQAMRDLAPTTRVERLQRALLRKLVGEEPIAGLGHLLLFVVAPGTSRSRWLKERFFPPEVFLRYRYGNQSGLHRPLTRFFRPFYLLGQALRLSLRVFDRLIHGPRALPRGGGQASQRP